MFIIPNILDNLKNGSHKKIKGTVVLMKNNVLDFNDFHASVLDRVHELLGKGVSLQLINVGDSSTGTAAKLGKKAYLENWIGTLGRVTAGDTRFKVTFDVEGEIGVPGAFVIRNNHQSQFFLKTVKLEDVPGAGDILFVCNSWVYPASNYKKDRIFFANKTYLPSDTPLALRKYRQQELEQLRGDGTGQLKESDRVYDYACYNDLSDPDKGSDHKRQTLGGSSEYPYPRRGRTGRPPLKSHPNCESRIPLLTRLDIYVPRDERFGHLKMSDFLAYALKSLVQFVKPNLLSIFDKTPNEFDSFQDVLNLYEGGLPLPQGLMKNIGDKIPLPMIKEIFRTDGERFLKFPVPQVIKGICQN